MLYPILLILAIGSMTVSPVYLTCEHLLNPLGIDVAHPRLSWTLSCNGRDEVQTAYQVLVASSEELLEAGKGDLWDSGKVASDQSVLVPYAGKPLTSEARCFWKVRVWDRRGKRSAWSATASWTMGLLGEADWKGKWVANRAKLDADETLPETMKGRQPGAESLVTQRIASPLLRKTFEASKPVKRATAYICGLGFFELRINGGKVGDSVLEADFTRYDKRALYVTHDVTALIKQGANAIGVMLGNGWYNCHSRDAWDFDHAAWRNTPRLLFQMRVEYADGSSDLVVSDGSWKTALGPVVFDCIRNGETYDARLEKRGWDMAGYPEHPEPVEGRSDWKPVEIVDGPGGKLVAQSVPPVKVMETIRPVKLTEPKPGIFVFDFGCNVAGWCELSVAGPVGTRVTLRYDERLHADGTLDQQNAVHVYSGEFQTDIYTLKGVGAETWEPRFVYHGFQYVQVEGFASKPTVDSLLAKVVHTSFDKTGEFECSDHLLNKIQRNTLRSYVSNFVGYPTDCPHREKNGWTGDAQLAAETGLYNFGAEAGYSRWMYDFDDCQREAGDLPGIVPTGTWGYNVGPAWDSAYMLIPWYLYLYRGDAGPLKAHYEGFKRYVDYLTSRSQDHIVSYGLGDWCPPEGGSSGYATPAALTSTAYYYVDAKIVAEVAKMLGKAEDAHKYSELAEEIRKAFIGKFYDPKTGTYEGGEQCGMAAALYQGLVPSGEKDKVMKALVAEIEKRGGHVWAGILGAKYILHALTDNGRADVAFGITTKRDFPSWGCWIEQGATTLWENWSGGGSRNHIMFGDIGAWFYEALAGINPDPAKPGFKHIIIRPRPVGDLRYVRAWHRSPYGSIGSSWNRGAGKLNLGIEIPANTTATVYVPAASVDRVTADGRHASSYQGVKFIGMQDGCAVFEVGSGTYVFRVML